MTLKSEQGCVRQRVRHGKVYTERKGPKGGVSSGRG